MGKSTGSIAVALVVGAAIGFVAGKAGTPSAPPTKPPEAGQAEKADGNKPPPTPQPVAAAQYFNVPFDPLQPTKGSVDAKVTIIEVSDFQ